MLAVQTAEENLYVPEWAIASLTPVHPHRTRVVLADGTVAHRPGPPPAGPWVPLHHSWVLPHHLTREGDFWKDPGDYLYPYAPLAELEIEEEESGLPEGLIAFEVHDKAYFWRTDTGLEPADLKPAQAEQLYPQLCLVAPSYLINTARVRRYGLKYGKGTTGWFQLDNGECIEFAHTSFGKAYRALGVDSLTAIDRNQQPALRLFRDFPYDLTTGDPERIRRDCPTPLLFVYNLLWQAVLQHLSGQPNDYGRDQQSFTLHPVMSAAQRCGIPVTKADIRNTFTYLVFQRGMIQLRQLGFLESKPQRWFVGATRPEILLIAPFQETDQVLPAARQAGISLLLSQYQGDRLTLEHLTPQLPNPLYPIFYQIEPAKQKKVLAILEHLEVSWIADPVQLPALADLSPALSDLPTPDIALHPEPFRRIPLQASESQLLMADPEEIAAWTPTRFHRWRVVLADGQVLHHPGPVPPGPWIACGGEMLHPTLIQNGKDPADFPHPDPPPAPLPPPHPLMPPVPSLPCPPEQVLYLEASSNGATWHLDDGRQIAASLSAEGAAAQHPGLIRLSRTCWVHHNRIRLTNSRSVQLDGGKKLPMATSHAAFQLMKVLQIPSFNQLAPDAHRLQQMHIRDFPFEIVRAPAAILRRYFPTATILICNILYQSFDIYQKTGIRPYGDGFLAYFYRPLQATLYRAGFLTRSQLRESRRPGTAKERQYQIFTHALFAMVYRYKLFTYRQFGFKDPALEDGDRILGTLRPQQILLVEKGDQLETFGRLLQEQFGLTLIVLKGFPSLLASEYLAEALKELGLSEVEVYFYGDFDYAGWDIGPAFLRHLLFYGIRCSRLQRLVMPECFTPEELVLYSRPLHPTTPTIAGWIQRWIHEGGGLNGEARGIHANWLSPYERLSSRLAQLIG